MDASSPSADADAPTALQRVRAHAVHLYTASGVVLAFFAAAEICQAQPNPRVVFAYLFAAVLVDATDGILARRWNVKTRAASIDGRTIDDIVDYLTYTFLPLLLMWRMAWLPAPGAAWAAPALIASLFGFSNLQAKDEKAGFFLGFPSYWNVVAFYAGILGGTTVAWMTGLATLALAVLTVTPIRFIYPNLTPPPWRGPVLVGALFWLAVLSYLLWSYQDAPRWAIWISLLYPVLYTFLSVNLQWKQRQKS